MKKDLEIGTNRFWNRKKIWRFFGRDNGVFDNSAGRFTEGTPGGSFGKNERLFGRFPQKSKILAVHREEAKLLKIKNK